MRGSRSPLPTIMEQEIRIPAGPREIEAYLVVPEGPPVRRPAVVVIHEIFGPDAHIRDVTRRVAAQGYVAIAPNLFSGPLQEVLTPPNVTVAMRALADAPPGLRGDPSKMAEFAASRPPEQRPVLNALAEVSNPATQAGFAEDLARVTGHLRTHPSVDPDRIASVGFCFGGAMSGQLATVDPRLRAAVIFYGQNPPLELVPKIRAHVLGLYGGEDPGITSKVPELAAAMKAAGGSFESHVYAGARHAFFNDTRPSNYHRESAEDAWPRVLGFLRTEFARPV
jgi:carboxymethylenebutenolidase